MGNQLIYDYLKYEKEIKDFKIINVHSRRTLSIKVQYEIEGYPDLMMVISFLDLMNFSYEHTNKIFFIDNIGNLGPIGEKKEKT